MRRCPKEAGVQRYRAGEQKWQIALTDQLLKDQGLLSVKELRVKIDPPLEGTRIQGQSSRGLSDGGWCGEGEIKAPLYPI